MCLNANMDVNVCVYVSMYVHACVYVPVRLLIMFMHFHVCMLM